MRLIDADALKDKLQQHHDFYVMARGGFGKMPIGEKKRVDEIINCIAEVVNAPTIEPKQVTSSADWLLWELFEGEPQTEMQRLKGKDWTNALTVEEKKRLLEGVWVEGGADMRKESE